MQVKVCLQQNEELRSTLDMLRSEKASLPGLGDKASQASLDSGRVDNVIEPHYAAEFHSLQVCNGLIYPRSPFLVKIVEGPFAFNR